MDDKGVVKEKDGRGNDRIRKGVAVGGVRKRRKKRAVDLRSVRQE